MACKSFNSYIYIFQKLFFSTAMDPINAWKIEEGKDMAAHLSTCPYNVRCSHYGWTEKSERWNFVLSDLRLKLKQKQIPSMWSESLYKA